MRIVPLVLVLLSGCTLIDQRTFEGHHAAPGAAELTAAHLPPLPLVVIRFDQPDVDFRPALAEAVQAAQARKPDVAFDVLTPVPLGASAAAQESATAQGWADALLVANALAADGVVPDRVHMGLRGDPGMPPREVRVYAR